MEVSLAAALLRRKELQEKVKQLQQINIKDLFEVKAKRQAVSDSIDDVVASVPKIKIEQITEAYDWHARRLREVDLAIQQANHSTKITIGDAVMDDFKSVLK
jgi:CTP synthase (UTP-ammonia lyase)